MPGADGKMMDMEFRGMEIAGFDNVKKKFVSSWWTTWVPVSCCRKAHMTPPRKPSLTQRNMNPCPNKNQDAGIGKLTDKDHHIFEFYEDRGGTEVKTMEINSHPRKIAAARLRSRSCACRGNRFWHDSVHAKKFRFHFSHSFFTSMPLPAKHTAGFGMAFHARRSCRLVRTGHDPGGCKLD